MRSTGRLTLRQLGGLRCSGTAIREFVQFEFGVPKSAPVALESEDAPPPQLRTLGANPSEPDRLKVIRMRGIGHNRQGANPTQLSHLFSEGYALKEACFWQIVCLRPASYSRLGVRGWRIRSGAAKRVRAKPSEPDRLKVIGMSGIGHNRQGANPTQLSRLFSEGYAPKRACFWQIVCLRVRSNCRLRSRRPSRRLGG